MPAGLHPYYVSVADLNGDGYLDICAANRLDNNIGIYLNDGNGDFSGNISYFAGGSGPQGAYPCDLDGDGDLDITIPLADADSILILLNNGIAEFSLDTILYAGDFPYAVAAADLDNDGDLDIVSSNRDSDNIIIYRNEICIDSDGDHFGDPGYPDNTCQTDNCPDYFNPLQEDYDLDGLGDSCDDCNSFMLTLTAPDSIPTRVTELFAYYPDISDPDDTIFTINYDIYPDWCTIQNDSLIGTPPGDTIVYYDTISYTMMDECNVDSAFITIIAYLCGNFNGDDKLNLLDITYLINYLYRDGPAPDPVIAADVNDDDSVNLLDITYLVSYLYKYGPEPVCQ